jgi:hypothetical protein
MEGLISQSNIVFAIGILGTVFTVYRFIRDPQTDGEKRDALAEQSIKFYIQSTDTRFADMQKQITSSQQLANNHIHTIDTKVDEMGKGLIGLGTEITRLATIIEERVPKKSNNS